MQREYKLNYYVRIAELLRPANSQVVTVIYYLWNGKQRIIEEQ